MKFKVTLVQTHIFGGARTAPVVREIEAEYFRVEGGALVFRNPARNQNEYPKTVHVFAPGMWIEVCEATSSNVIFMDDRDRFHGGLEYERG